MSHQHTPSDLTLLDSVDAAIYISDMQTYELLFMNKKARQASTGKIGDKCWATLQAGQDGPCPFCTNNRLVDKNGRPNGPYVWEFQNTLNGEWYKCRDQAILWSDNRLVRIEIATNISKRKQAEQNLAKERERLSIALHGTNSGLWDLDLTTGKIYFDENYFTIARYRPNDFPHHFDEWKKRIHPEDIQKTEEAIENYISGKSSHYSTEFRFKTKDGAWLWILGQGEIVERDKDGRPVRFVGLHIDINERKQIEDALRQSEQRYRGFFENSLVGIFQSTPAGRYIKVNAAFATMLGYDSPQDLIESIIDIGSQLYVNPADRARYNKLLSDQGYALNFIHRLKHKNGSERWISTNSRAICNDNGELSHFEGISIDITERKKTDEALRTSEENLRTTLNSIGDAVIATDIDHKIIQMNPVAEYLTGWTAEEAKEKRLTEVFNISNAKTGVSAESPVTQALRSGQVVGLANHTILTAKDGRKSQIADSAAPIRNEKDEITGVVLVFRDVTEEYLMREELQKMQQLEKIGTLAGGIAHDFNNILSGIFGNIAMAKRYADGDHPCIKYLEQAENSANRAKNLTAKLLTFAKGGEPIKEYVSLGNLIKEVAEFDLSGSNVKLVFEQENDLWATKVDKGQIQQVFSNLVINAFQAMPEGGHLYINLRNQKHAEDPLSKVNPGKYVQAIIRDEGGGIKEKDLPRIFDPYFSTKQTGRGLGLATVYSIIDKHGGHIRVNSVAGQGTTFTLCLPAADKAVLTEYVPGVEDATLEKQDIKILLMDDDEAIRRLTTKMLGKAGCAVKTAADGKAAVQMFKQAIQAETPYDLVIMDLTIPGGMGGKETIKEILKIKPDAKAIVSSGYADDPVMAHFSEYGFRGVVAKPYTLQELTCIINRVLKS